MTPLYILEGVKALLASPMNWTQRSMSREESGMSVHPTNATATCWCLSGAIVHLTGGIDENWRDACWALSNAIAPGYAYGVSIPAWNDVPGRTYDEVMAVVDRAIEHEKEKVATT